MRTAVRGRPSRSEAAIVRSIPAPVGGWNTEQPLADMKPQFAVILDNVIPRRSKCELRRGFVQQVTGTGAVESMIAWRGSASGDKLFACAGANIYETTSQGSLGAAVYASAVNARWHYTNFSNDAGRYAIAANAANTPQKYDGSAFGDLTITGSSGSITLDPTDLTYPMLHKRRLWFIENGTLRTWFLQTNAIQGAATLLDLGPIFYKGGVLVAQGTWSLDGGAGMDDVAVFYTNEGQVAIYQGLDPTDPDQWSLVGVFDLAKPVGNKPLIKWGPDLALITEDGVLPLSQALSKDREEAKKNAITSNIATAFSQASLAYGANHGWCGITYSGRGALAIFNIPTTELSEAVQYVQSIEGGGWCRFTGINAICWEQANGEIYFGSTDGVYRWDIGSSDNSEVVTGDVKPAFNAFGDRRRQKEFTMVRAILTAPAIIRPALEVLVDYEERIPTAVATTVEAGDISPDDEMTPRDDWTGATGIGYVASPRMRISIMGAADADQIAIDSTLTDLLLDESGGDNILTRPNLPLDVSVEIIGFDVMFKPGGYL